MVIAALLLSQSLQADQPVTYETRGRDLPAVLADLSAQTGVQCEARGLKDRPLIIRVQKMPLKKLLDTIAEVTDSQWGPDQGRLLFTRGAGRVEEGRLREASNRGDRARAFIRAHLPVDEPIRAWNDADFAAAREENNKRYAEGLSYIKTAGFNSAQRADAITPARIVLLDFLRKVDPKLLGGVGLNSRAVYSTTALRYGEQRMPVDLAEAAAYALEARERAAQVLATPGDEKYYRTNTSLLTTPVSRFSGIKVLLTRGTSSRLDVEVMLMDKVVVDYSGVGLDLGSPLLEDAPEGLSGRVSLTDFDNALVKTPSYPSLFGIDSFNGWGASIRPQLPAPVRFALADPVTHEPMGTLPASWMLSTADALNTDVISYIPDWSFAIILDRLRGQMTLRDLWKSQLKLGMKLELRNGILVAQPSEQWVADRARIDRSALRKLLQTYSEKSLPRLEDLAEYVDHAPRFDEYNLDTTWMKLLDPNGRVFAWLENGAAVRFVASLKLRKTDTTTEIRTDNLTAKQTQDLQAMLSGSKSGREGVFRATSSRSGERQYSIAEPSVEQPVRPGLLTIMRRSEEGRLLTAPNGDFVPIRKGELRDMIAKSKSIPLRIDLLTFRLDAGLGIIMQPQTRVHDVYLVPR